ncbi:MAG: glycosyltransferase family 39 protein [Anaerolineales bacterium]|jgi:hypothetical protein
MIKINLNGAFKKFAEIDRNKRLQYLLLASITLLAAVLRFYKLGEWSFWIDEIFTVEVSQGPAIYSFAWPRISIMLIGTALRVLGISEWSARLAPALIGVISIPILYFPVRKMYGSGVALTASILLTISPWHLFWSQNVRFYTSLMLLYTLALLFFHYALEEDRPGYMILSLIFFASAALERYTALFFVPVVLVYLLLLKVVRSEKPPGLRFRNLLIFLLPFIAVVIIELYSYISSGTFQFFRDFDWFFLYRNDDPIRLLGNISFNLGIPLIVLAIFSGVFLLIKKNHAGLLMISGAVVPTVILIAANPFIFTKDRYVFITLFSWVILAAYGINELIKSTDWLHRWLAVAVLMILFFDAASDSLLYYKVNNGNRRDWKGAFALVQQRGREGDDVVMWWPELGHYYLNKEIIAWRDIDPETVVRSGKRFWFVTDSETVWGNTRMKQWVEQNAELVEVFYLRLPDDFSLRVYLYDPARNETADKSNIEPCILCLTVISTTDKRAVSDWIDREKPKHRPATKTSGNYSGICVGSRTDFKNWIQWLSGLY